MLTGSLLPYNKVYALVKVWFSHLPDSSTSGMGRSTLNDWVALFERDDRFGMAVECR